MEELDLKELLEMFWNKKIQIILIIAIFAVIGAVYSVGFVTPMYESYTSVILAQTSNKTEGTNGSESITASDLALNSKLVSTYTEIVKSKALIRTVISNLNLKLDEDAIRQNVTVSAKTDTEFIKITVRNQDPVLATKIANEVTKVLQDSVKEIYKIGNVVIIDEAEVPGGPCNINHAKDVVIFAFIGLVVAVVYVLIANMLDTTIKSKEDVEKLNVPVLVTIPVYEFNTEIAKKKKGGKNK